MIKNLKVRFTTKIKELLVLSIIYEQIMDKFQEFINVVQHNSGNQTHLDVLIILIMAVISKHIATSIKHAISIVQVFFLVLLLFY